MNALPPSLAAIGLDPASQDSSSEQKLVRYIQLKLAALGFSVPSASGDDPAFQEIAQALLANHLEKNRLLSSYLAPADRRVQDWLERYLDSGLWRGKAGAYGIQDGEDPFIELESGEWSTVVGLPMSLVKRELACLKRG